MAGGEGFEPPLAEFEAYLRCGRLEHGFLRVKSSQCYHEHLVGTVKLTSLRSDLAHDH